MKTYISTVIILLCTVMSFAQKKEKIKGNRNVITQQHEVASFTAIEIAEDLEIVLVNGSKSGVEVTADENLHDVLSFDVSDELLTVSTTKRIRSKKKLEIYITITEDLNKIRVSGRAKLNSLTTLNTNSLEIMSLGSSRLDLKINSDSLAINSFEKADGRYELTSKQLKLSVNESSELKGKIEATDLMTYMEHANVKLIGKVDSLSVTAKGKASFVAPELVSKKASITASDQGKIVLQVTKDVSIDAIDNSEIELYGETPTIQMIRFANEAVLRKRELSQGGFLKKIF